MPIPFTCPHCGKQMQVPDEYAGQSGPCQACGKPITIPGTSFVGTAPRSSSGSGMGVLLAVLLGVGFLGLLCIGCLAALLIPAVTAARGAAQRVNSMNNMKMMGLALHNYHDVYQQFPPAVVRDADGNALYSGRVLLLPFLEQNDVYQQWDKDQAWDSPANRPLSDTAMAVFRDASATSDDLTQTDYLFIVGSGSAFEETEKGIALRDFTDGTSNTILVMEVKDSGVNWAEPRDIDIADVWPQTGNHPDVVLVLFADGSVQNIPTTANAANVQAMATRNGGEVVDRDDF